MNKGLIYALIASTIYITGCAQKVETTKIIEAQLEMKIIDKINDMSANSHLIKIKKLFENDNSVYTSLCDVKGAKYAMVHVLSAHRESKITSIKFSKKELDGFNKDLNGYQKNLYEIYSKLAVNGYNNLMYEPITEYISKDEIKNFYEEYLPFMFISGLIKIEGLNIPDQPTEIRRLIKIEKRTINEISKLRKEIDKYLTKLKDYEILLKDKYSTASNYEDFAYAPGAGLLLNIEGILNLYPAANSEVNDIAVKVEKYMIEFNYNPVVLDLREDVVLRYIAELKKSVIIAEFGYSHEFFDKGSCDNNYQSKGRMSFWNNIEKWNIRYPNEKIALIEISPKMDGYEYLVKERENIDKENIKKIKDEFFEQIPFINIPYDFKKHILNMLNSK